MHVPFSYTAYISEHAATLLGMIGIRPFVLPDAARHPAIYVWTISGACLLVSAAQGAGAQVGQGRGQIR